MGWLQDHLWVVVGVIVAAALVLAGLVWWSARRRPPAISVPGAAARRRVDLTFAAAVLVTLAVGWAAVLWLLGKADQVPAGKDRAAAQADAIRTGATIALGTGGAAYLLLAYRRQRLEEVDTRERRITELFTKAVEQLGHEKAPVRLGALYSLERLAQDNPEHRQTVVDVFCAYLRMPYTLPAPNKPGAEQVAEAPPPVDDRDRAPHPVPRQDPAQELQVRQTAQRILAAHLRLPPGIFSPAAQRRPPSPRRAFWPGISLDLIGATLVDFNFAKVSVVQARFDKAAFQGNAQFHNAAFQGFAGFVGATFQGGVWFDGATFQGFAGFTGATFQGGGAGFVGATFQRDAGFTGATFQGIAAFDGATFQGKADLGAAFHREARFGEATFQGFAWFSGATFQGFAGFSKATFHREAQFGDQFGEATFQRGWVGEARVLHLDNPDLNKRRVWPDGCTVRPDPADPTRGTLVHAEQAERPEPAVPPSDPTSNGSGTG